jgi:hypothetical protein
VAEWTRREVVTRRIEFWLPSPTVVAKVWKAITAASSELPDHFRHHDAVTVEARDGEIVVWIELP